jgi:RNA polymerase sigma factor (sigma-70 family)
MQTLIRYSSPNPYEVSPENVERVRRGALVMAHRWIARLPAWMDRESFLGEVMLAVAMARRQYRPEMRVTFAHFAYTCVAHALVDEARRQDPVGRERRKKLRRGLVEETPADLPPLSLQALVSDGLVAYHEWVLEADPHDVGLVDPAPGPEALLLAAEERRRIRTTLQVLSEQERMVVLLRYWGDESQTAIARVFGVSSQRIQQIEKQACAKLREQLQREEAEPEEHRWPEWSPEGRREGVKGSLWSARAHPCGNERN